MVHASWNGEVVVLSSQSIVDKSSATAFLVNNSFAEILNKAPQGLKAL